MTIQIATASCSTKEKILASAQELFGQHGFSRTTFRRIADHAGVTLALISHHFGSKENLFMQASLTVLDEIESRLLASVEQAPNGRAAVKAFLDTYLGCSLDKGLNFRILVRCSPYNDLAEEVGREEVAKRFKELIHMLAGCLARGMRDGSIIECDSFKTADVIFAAIVGSVRTNLLSGFAFDGFYDEAKTFILRSITPCRDQA